MITGQVPTHPSCIRQEPVSQTTEMTSGIIHCPIVLLGDYSIWLRLHQAVGCWTFCTTCLVYLNRVSPIETTFLMANVVLRCEQVLCTRVGSRRVPSVICGQRRQTN